FTPWTTVRGYQDLLDAIADLDLIEAVAPVQLAIRLLIPAGSRMLELPEVEARLGRFDPVALVHPWRPADPDRARPQRAVEARVGAAATGGESRRAVFESVLAMTESQTGRAPRSLAEPPAATTPVPHMTEAWYCCAEPLTDPVPGAPAPI